MEQKEDLIIKWYGLVFGKLISLLPPNEKKRIQSICATKLWLPVMIAKSK
jgi:hypothetical protein